MSRLFLLCFCLLALVLVVPEAAAQGGAVSGIVTDETGAPLPGVNVAVDGTTRGTITDPEGAYRLAVPGPNATLVFSFVGYVTRRVEVEGREVIDVGMEPDLVQLEEMVVVGYGTQERADVTGSVERVDAEQFESQSMTQLTDMLTGTVAGFAANQSTGPAGGSSLEIRGQNSLTAGTEPMIVVDGAIYNGSLRDINPADIETIDILKDASSAAVYGAKAASGVILITTTRGKRGKPTISYSSQIGMAEATRERRPISAEEYVQFRADWFRTVFPNQDYHYYTSPDQLPDGMSIEQWRAMSESPLADDTREFLRRLAFFPIEQENYINGRTVDWYDVVMQSGVRQSHDLSIAGGSEDATYYWSIGYVENEGLQLGDDFSTVRSRLNAEYDVVDWLSVGLNAQFADRDEGGVAASMGFYANSPYGQIYDEAGNLERLAHGHTDNPLLEYYLRDNQRRINSLFGKLYADFTLPYGFKHQVSFQPRFETMRELEFRGTDVRFGGDPKQDQSQGSRERYTQQEWIIDNLLTWNRAVGVHEFDVTLLHSVEESREWYERMANQNFSPNEHLGFHGLQFGDSPTIVTNDMRVTGDALMARLNYALLNRYLVTASVRRDGYSAFGQDRPRATFPALAFAWQVANEPFFNVDWVDQLKLRLSWGINGNRDIGAYSALARLSSRLWFDGTTTRVGVYNATLANPGLRWEKTKSLNGGLDLALFENRVTLTLDAYDATTTDLLMNRRLPSLTGFRNVTTNLGKLRNRGFEATLRTLNHSSSKLVWNSDFVFSMNRNEIVELFGDTGAYTILGQTYTGELPDFTNQWFPGRAIDAVWDYDVTGVWQLDEAEQAAVYGMRPGDFRGVDVNGDGVYRAEDDKQFIGYLEPRYRLGFKNEVSFLKHWTASAFIRADLGHIGAEPEALNPSEESNDRRGRHTGPVPYWTPQNPINDYARLDLLVGGYGGGVMVYRPRSFVRIQDVTLSYRLPVRMAQALRMQNLRVYGSVRNLATFTRWPHWDPESGRSPMPRMYTMGLSLSL